MSKGETLQRACWPVSGRISKVERTDAHFANANGYKLQPAGCWGTSFKRRQNHVRRYAVGDDCRAMSVKEISVCHLTFQWWKGAN